MPLTGEPNNDWLDPENKPYIHGYNQGGGGRPGGFAGGPGGSGLFLTTPTYGGGSAPMMGARRRTPGYGAATVAPTDGYQSSGLTATQETAPGPGTTPSAGQQYVQGYPDPIGPSGLTASQEKLLSGYPPQMREKARKSLLAYNQANMTSSTSPTGGMYDFMSGGGASDWGKLMNMLLGKGGKAGYFDPGGSSDVMQSIKSKYTTAGGDAERKARTLAMLANPDDPSAAGYGAMKASLDTASNASRSLDDALLSERQKYEDWIRNLMDQNMQFNMNYGIAGLNNNSGGRQSRGMGISVGPVGFQW